MTSEHSHSHTLTYTRIWIPYYGTKQQRNIFKSIHRLFHRIIRTKTSSEIKLINADQTGKNPSNGFTIWMRQWREWRIRLEKMRLHWVVMHVSLFSSSVSLVCHNLEIIFGVTGNTTCIRGVGGREMTSIFPIFPHVLRAHLVLEFVYAFCFDSIKNCSKCL